MNMNYYHINGQTSFFEEEHYVLATVLTVLPTSHECSKTLININNQTGDSNNVNSPVLKLTVLLRAKRVLYWHSQRSCSLSWSLLQ